MRLPLRWLFLLQSSGLVVMQHVRSSRTRDWTLSPALAGRFLFTVPLRKSRRFLLNTAISYDKRWDGGDKILCRDWTKTINGAQALSLINTRTLYTHPHACTHTPYSKPSDVGEQNITGIIKYPQLSNRQTWNDFFSPNNWYYICFLNSQHLVNWLHERKQSGQKHKYLKLIS